MVELLLRAFSSTRAPFSPNLFPVSNNVWRTLGAEARDEGEVRDEAE